VNLREASRLAVLDKGVHSLAVDLLHPSLALLLKMVDKLGFNVKIGQAKMSHKGRPKKSRLR
jgi:hypothetical protein